MSPYYFSVGNEALAKFQGRLLMELPDAAEEKQQKEFMKSIKAPEFRSQSASIAAPSGKMFAPMPPEWLDASSWKLPSGQALAAFALHAGYLGSAVLGQVSRDVPRLGHRSRSVTAGIAGRASVLRQGLRRARQAGK